MTKDSGYTASGLGSIHTPEHWNDLKAKTRYSAISTSRAAEKLIRLRVHDEILVP